MNILKFKDFRKETDFIEKSRRFGNVGVTPYFTGVCFKPLVGDGD